MNKVVGVTLLALMLAGCATTKERPEEARLRQLDAAIAAETNDQVKAALINERGQIQAAIITAKGARRAAVAGAVISNSRTCRSVLLPTGYSTVECK